MANIKSQIKRVKTNAARTERNRAYKSVLRTWIRKVRTAADAELAQAEPQQGNEFKVELTKRTIVATLTTLAEGRQR